MIENRVAKYWNIMPWDFRGLSRDHKAELVATYLTDNQISAYYNSERMRKFDQTKKER